MIMGSMYQSSGRVRLGFLPHIYGQQKLKTELSRLVEEDRLPHTMIFYGDEGLGKTTAALDLSGALTGQDVWKETRPWFHDPAFEKELVLIAADDQVWYIRPVGMELKIEQFRLFLDAMPSFDGRPHICIIDEAQTMMPAIANAMLKTLEEPEGNVYFVLITHDLDALLPTIISRGERFAFFPLARNDYGALLSAFPEEFHTGNGEDIEQAFLLSEGNPGMTKEMFGEEGMPQPETAMAFWELVTESDIPFAKGMEALPEDRKEFRKWLRWLILVGRDLMVTAAAPDGRMERCRQVAERERRIAPEWNGGRAEEALEVLKTADAACRRYISIKNIWDMVLISLVHIRKGQYTWNRW